MRIFYIILSVLFFASFSFGQTIYSEDDMEVCNTKFEFAASGNLQDLPINNVIVEIGKSFLGLDYEAHTIEKGDKEQLVIHLTGLDCYTFLESSLVFSRCIKKGSTGFEDYQKELINLRYRDGAINGYPSRLHYASDWLYDNDKRGNFKDITRDIGGILYTKKIDFMSTHPQSYKRLKNNSDYVNAIAVIESEITDRENYYVPENFVDCVEDKIQNGDIILITASTQGLDISHTGIAVKMVSGRIHFMHAPTVGKKIQITDQPIGEYIKGLKRHTGIMVGRALEPDADCQ